LTYKVCKCRLFFTNVFYNLFIYPWFNSFVH
jgi:hypothetical protein